MLSVTRARLVPCLVKDLFALGECVDNPCPNCGVKHGPCAICDGDDSTGRLCASCRRDPANVDWRRRNELLFGETDSSDHDSQATREDAIDRAASRRPRLAAQAPPQRTPTLMQRRILELMTFYTIRVRVRRRVRQGGGKRTWVWREESCPLPYREIAFLLGCSESYCRKTYRAVAG